MAGGPAMPVVLVHGALRGRPGLLPTAAYLRRRGFDPRVFGYRTRRDGIDGAARRLGRAVARWFPGERGAVGFLTHSMGGLVVRQYLSQTPAPGTRGRVVLLAPPNKGSELVDTLKDVPGFEWLSGPAGIALSADIDSIPNTISDADAEYGVIAGDLSLNPLYSSLIPGDDDGKVSVESTKFAAMTDHIVVNASHTFIMNSSDVAGQVIAFLRTGRFLRPVD